MQSNSNIQIFYPPIIGAEELARLLKRKNITIDKSRRPHTVPEAYRPVDTQKPLWITEDVIKWLRQFKETPRDITDVKKGAPTKAERIAKAKRTNLSK